MARVELGMRWGPFRSRSRQRRRRTPGRACPGRGFRDRARRDRGGGFCAEDSDLSSEGTRFLRVSSSTRAISVSPRRKQIPRPPPRNGPPSSLPLPLLLNERGGSGCRSFSDCFQPRNRPGRHPGRAEFGGCISDHDVSGGRGRGAPRGRYFQRHLKFPSVYRRCHVDADLLLGRVASFL